MTCLNNKDMLAYILECILGNFSAKNVFFSLSRILEEFVCKSLKNLKLPLRCIAVFTGYFLISSGYIVTVGIRFRVFNFLKFLFFFPFLFKGGFGEHGMSKKRGALYQLIDRIRRFGSGIFTV